MTIFTIKNPEYEPSMRIISNITNAKYALVTTTFDHDFVSGNTVRLHVPNKFGMTQADKHQGIIYVTSPITFTISIDTTQFNAFTMPTAAPDSFQQAYVVLIKDLISVNMMNIRT